MKLKKMNQKLLLNKQTVAGLNGEQMAAVKGGETEIELCATLKACSITSCPVTWPGHTCIDC